MYGTAVKGRKRLAGVATRIETFLVAAHDVSAGNLTTDEQIGVCYFVTRLEIVDCTKGDEARATLLRVLGSVWAAEIRILNSLR